MFHLRPYIVAIILSCSLSTWSQSHDFEVRDFHENVTDLKAASSNVKDINGVVTALIRFAVRDTLFTFEANNGIVKRQNAVGEILLFVPTTTKRLTIRHPYLGIFRDYQLPMVVESKTTYDAEIVITNADYMRRMYGYDQRPNTDESAKIQDEIILEKPSNDAQYQSNAVKQEKPKKQHKSVDFKFLLGGGYNAIGMTGPQISAGIHLGILTLSADYTIGMEKVEGVGIYYKISGYGEELGEAYDYSVSRFSVRLGLGSQNASVQIIPQIGASFNMIRGKEIVNILSQEAQFSESNPISLSTALSLRIRLFKPLYLTITPQYDFAIGADDVYKVIKDADSKIKTWGEGFGVCVGLLFSL